MDDLMDSLPEEICEAPAVEVPDEGFVSYEKLIQQGKEFAKPGKKTGISDLDKGMKIRAGELLIIGARPRHGKSSLAYNIFLNFIESHKDETFIFYTLDVCYVEFLSRLATIWAKKWKGISLGYEDDVFPHLVDEKFDPAIKEALSVFDTYGKEKRMVVVEDIPSVEKICAHAEALAADHNIGAAFIDYIGRVSSDTKTDTEELRTAHITKMFKTLSMNVSAPVIALSQMNRASASQKQVEHRRPTLEGLRYSGQQEQEAGKVLGVFNVAVESADAAREDGEVFAPSSVASIDLIPLKNRGGATGKSIPAVFDMKSGHITHKVSEADWDVRKDNKTRATF